MGWRGTVRSISAAMRAAERDAQRNRKQAMKKNVAANAAAAITSREDYLDRIVSIHSDISDEIDWLAMAHKPKPVLPQMLSNNEESARKKLKNFKPGILERLSGGGEKRRKKLELAVASGREKDALKFEKQSAEYDDELAEWSADTNLARRLVAGEAAALREVVSEMQGLTSETLIGSGIEFDFDDNHVHARPLVHSDEIVPNTRLKQLSGGGLSESKMPDGQFNELYQDYVASVSIRVAGDLFRITPMPEVYVTCFCQMLDLSTGHQEHAPILSVHFVRETFSQLRLGNVDPSEAIKNFRHTMNFKRSKGFSKIEPLVAQFDGIRR